MRMPAESGLYAITDPELCREPGLVAAVESALRGGATMVQYRDKTASRDQRLREAGELLAICRRFAKPLIVNDDLDIALALDADGLHVGAADGDPRRMRAALKPGMLLGVSCYDSLDAALDAERAGADYVAFGSLFASSTKPVARRAPLSLLREARARLGIPVVAIGGITLDNAPQVIAAGAQYIAVIGGLFGATDIESTAAGFVACFNPKP